MSVLRADQQAVVDAFVAYRALPAERRRWAHVVLPPRTGKTVIAAHIAKTSGLHAAFVVPTKVLVRQTCREIGRHAPGLPVGAWFGDEKATVERGLNVTTYASLARHRERWSERLASAELVFVDEAHHALTPERARALAEAFPTDALRIALTATPDYDDRRRLATLFPEPLARMELRTALDAGLLAPARVSVAEVDADGSSVELVAGEYRPDQLARLLSGGPFLHAALAFRYRPDLADIPCVVACVTRQQADDLCRYFVAHRPPGRPGPGLILGETPADVRERLLARFEAGAIDTLVQVGVLVEGWTSPRCKLMIDLAPGRSRVRATQKYFRVLTRNRDEIANIVVIVPRDLPRPPVLPMDLLLDPGEVWESSRAIGEPSTRRALDPAKASPIARVRLVQRLVVCAPLGVPRLDPGRADHVRELLASCPDFRLRPVTPRRELERLYFQHPRFSGTGRMLLAWVKVGRTPHAYERWLGSLYPEEMADQLLGEATRPEEDAACAPDDIPEPPVTPEEALEFKEAVARICRVLPTVQPRARQALWRWCGLDGSDATLTEVGAGLGVSRERARQMTRTAIFKIRELLSQEEDAALEPDDAEWVRRARVRVHPRVLLARRFIREHRWAAAAAAARGLVAGGWQYGYVVEVELLIARSARETLSSRISELGTATCLDVRREIATTMFHARWYEELLAFVSTAPLSPLPRWQLGEALLRVGRTEQALAVLEGSRPDDEAGWCHRELVRHLAHRPWGRGVLEMLVAGAGLVADLLDGQRSGYARQTSDTWGESGARERLGAWRSAPEVRQWLEALRTVEDWKAWWGAPADAVVSAVRAREVTGGYHRGDAAPPPPR